MVYLIYELFSGVGFCNQLFSLETAIYLANITNRKLILIIRYPLCHCGSSSWEYGNFIEMFSSDYMQYLPKGIEIHYKAVPLDLQNKINSKSTQHIVFGQRISHLGIIDEDIFNKYNRNLSDSRIVNFLHGRAPYIMNIHTWDKEYIYINESNASRCFYNFLTSDENYLIMSKICHSLTKLKKEFYTVANNMKLPDSYVSFHFRFGDSRHSKQHIDIVAKQKYENIERLVERNKQNKIIIMSDRKDSDILDKLKKKKYSFEFTEQFIKSIPDTELRKAFPKVRDFRVVQFLLQKYICEKSSLFVGYHFSTVSNHIQYMNYINDKPYYYYAEGELKLAPNIHDWVTNGVFGASLSFKQFFRDNVKSDSNRSNTKLITLTNDGYLEMTENLLLSMKKIGIEQTLKIYCIGSKSYDYLRERFPNNEIEKVDVDNQRLSSWVEYRALQNPDTEGKKLWANITSYKMYVINNELIKGNNVIFTDGDIVFEKNPFSYIFDNIDPKLELLIQNDEQVGMTERMCTGFFWMKSNKNTIQITDFKTIRENIDHFQNDQQYLRRFGHKMNHKFFPLDLFPNGKHYREKVPKSPFIIHFNYDVSDHKVRRMKKFNKWYINERDIINPINDNIDYIDKHPITKYLSGKGIKLKQGTICSIKKQEDFIIDYLKNSKLVFTKILEIGFLAGHSANLFLHNIKNSYVTSIDQGKLQSINSGKEYIDAIYPNRHKLIKGDSIDKIKELGKDIFDLILIDGSYDEEIVLQDILLCKKNSHNDTIIIINNAINNKPFIKYWNKGPTNAWNKLTKEKKITTIIQQDFVTGVGLSICKYI